MTWHHDKMNCVFVVFFTWLRVDGLMRFLVFSFLNLVCFLLSFYKFSLWHDQGAEIYMCTLPTTLPGAMLL